MLGRMIKIEQLDREEHKKLTQHKNEFKQRGFIMQAKQHADTISRHEHVLIEKIRSLPPSRVTEVEDFIDFLRQSNADRQLTSAAATLSEKTFQQVWDNPEDAEYDRL